LQQQRLKNTFWSERGVRGGGSGGGGGGGREKKCHVKCLGG